MKATRFTAILLLAAVASSSALAETEVDEYALKDVNYWTASGTVPRGSNTAAYSGDTTGGPSWDRPFADGTCCSALGPVVYETEMLFVDTTAAYDINSVQDGWDGYLLIYQDNFDPLNQSANFYAGDDDGNGGIGTSDIEGLTLEAGRPYIVVTTGFAAGDAGTYTNSVTGPGNISFGAPVSEPALPVPSLGTWSSLLLMLTMAGMAVLSLQRRFGS